MEAKQSAIGARRLALSVVAAIALVLASGPLAAGASAQSAGIAPRHLGLQGDTASWSSANTLRNRTATTGGLRNGLRGNAATAPRYTGQQAVPPRRTSLPRSAVPGSANVPGSATAPGSATVPGAATAPGSTNVPGSAGIAPRSTTPGSTSSLTTSTSSSIAPPALATPSATSKARAHGGFTPSTPAIALAALAALLLLLVAAWALARAFAYEPAWMPSLRHSFAEAGFRASATWAELGDWLRLGR